MSTKRSIVPQARHREIVSRQFTLGDAFKFSHAEVTRIPLPDLQKAFITQHFSLQLPLLLSQLVAQLAVGQAGKAEAFALSASTF